MALALALGSPALAGATVASDLCTGNPCLISGTKVIDAGADIDFGATTDVRLQASAKLTVGPSAVVDRPVTLTARSIRLQPGAQILGGGDGAIVSLNSTGGDIELKRQGATASKVDVSGESAGAVWLAATGNVILEGDLLAGGNGVDSSGGGISIGATGSVTASGTLKTGASGTGSAGGDIDVDAGGPVTLSGPIDLAASSDAGSLSVFSDEGAVNVTSRIDASGGSPDGFGGTITVDASYGDVTVGGKIFANGGTGAEEQCGDGGTLSISSGLSVAINEELQLNGGTQCLGGTVEVVADGSFTQAAGKTIALRADGAFGGGGSFSVDAFGDALVRDVDLSGRGYGGSVDVDSASGLATMAGFVDARGTGAAGSFSNPGAIDVQGCSVVVSGRLDARGDFPVTGTGSVELTASDSMTIASTAILRALVSNALRIRSGAPLVQGMPTVDPAATTTVDPTIRACTADPVCGNGIVEATEFCDDGAKTGTAAGCCAADCRTAKETGATCDDGLFCNGADTCGVDDRCSHHAGSPCAGVSGPCASGTCSETLHCGVAPGTACDEGDANPCTAGQCSPDGTCAAQPIAGSCDDGDGNPCTAGQCSDGTCAAQPIAGSCDDGDGNPCTAGQCSDGTCAAQPIEASCDDGTFCNGAELCIEGKCRRVQRECPADACDEGGAACEPFCGDGVAQEGEQCGDGGLPACAPGSVCRDCACEPTELSADSYVCYQAVASASPAWAFTPVAKAIADRIESKTFDVTALTGVCSPAVVDSAQGTYLPANPGLGHVRHAIVQSTVPAPQAPFVPLNQSMTDRFGTVQVTLQAPNALLVRTKIRDFGAIVTCAGNGDCTGGDTCQSSICLPDPAKAPAQPPKNNVKVDNYKCYKAQKFVGVPFAKPKKVRIADGFGSTMLYDLQKPIRVCAPASLDGTNVAAPSHSTHLTCYQVKLSGGAPKQASFEPHSMGLRYRLFPAAFADALVPKEVCVPSTAAPLP